MTELRDKIAKVVATIAPPGPSASGGEKKNYTEALSHRLSKIIMEELQGLGLSGVVAPDGDRRDKQFMGGYGPKGVDVFLSDEKHGLLLTSGVKGLLFDPRKNLKNRYRDMVMEALELHKRFPYAVCGHLLFIGKSEGYKASKKFGTVLGEAVALLSNISGRERPDEAPELYETMGIILIEPGQPDSVDLAPSAVPPELQGERYCERLFMQFQQRNPFYE
jgi:hypothetical protein